MADTKCCMFTNIIFVKETLSYTAFGQSADISVQSLNLVSLAV